MHLLQRIVVQLSITSDPKETEKWDEVIKVRCDSMTPYVSEQTLSTNPSHCQFLYKHEIPYHSLYWYWDTVQLAASALPE